MTVYADILVLINLYIDFFLLRAVQRFLGLRAKNHRIVLGALAGGLLSLTALLPVDGIPALLLGVGTALAASAAAFAPLSPKLFWKAAGCFWLCGLGLAGMVLFLLRFFTPRRLALLGSVIYFDLSPGVLFVCTGTAYLVFILARRLLPEGRSALRCRWLTIERGGKAVRVYAKADTGNQLREPFSGLPVIVCQADCLAELAPAAALAYPGETDAPTEGLRLVPFDSLGGSGVLPAFRPDRVAAGEEQSADCYVALCSLPLSAGQIQALYNPSLFSHPTQKGGT